VAETMLKKGECMVPAFFQWNLFEPRPDILVRQVFWKNAHNKTGSE